MRKLLLFLPFIVLICGYKFEMENFFRQELIINDGCKDIEAGINQELINPISEQYLKKYLKRSLPRLVYTPKKVDQLRLSITDDIVIENLYKAIRIEAFGIMDEPLLERKLTGRRLLSVSREMLNRINKLGIVFLLEKDQDILKRINEEILAVCDFKDWNPSHFLDVAEMSLAVSLGLDWTHGSLPEETVIKAKEALISKALKPSWPEYGGTGLWWVNSNNNWNQVCHAGLIAASIVIAEDDYQLAASTISRALDKMPLALEEYMPDGIYPEGPTYWGYGTSFTIMAAEMLKSALDSDFGIKQFPGFMESAEFVSMTKSPTGMYYNFADCGDSYGRAGDIILAWFAAETGNTNYFDKELFLLPAENMNLNRLGGSSLVWMARFEEKENEKLPANWFGNGTNPVAIFTDKEGKRGYYLGAKGGAGILNHGNMDAGSFIFELDGVRWVIDPGVQPYHELEKTGFNLWNSCQDCDRWKLLTKNNFGHSTITVNDALHKVDGHAEMTEYKNGEFPEVTFDLTKTLSDQLETARRKFLKDSPASLLIEDYIKTSSETKIVTWQLLTTADVEITKAGALLKQDGKELVIKNLSHPEIKFDVISLDPPPFELDKRIENLKRIELRISAGEKDQEIKIKISLSGPNNG